MDYSLLGSSVHGMLRARILEWLPCPPAGDLADPGIEHRSPALQVDSLPSESPGKLKNNGWIAFCRDLPDPGIELGLLHYRWILYQLSSQGNPRETEGPTDPGQFLKALQLLLRCTT